VEESKFERAYHQRSKQDYGRTQIDFSLDPTYERHVIKHLVNHQALRNIGRKEIVEPEPGALPNYTRKTRKQILQ
jgi:hypothetical protein